MKRLPLATVDALMRREPNASLEAALDVFEVFASGSLTDEVYILDDVQPGAYAPRHPSRPPGEIPK